MQIECDKANRRRTYRSEYEQQCFNQRRLAQPIQDFPWLEVRDIPSINGRGIFAKTRILKDQIVCDYRGLFLTVEARDRMLEHMTREESELVGDYEVSYLGYIYDPKGKAARQAQDYSILAHDPIYKGAVVLGRLFNHSRKHANLKPLHPLARFRPTRGIRAST
ncbi:hypothetical protein COOONC_09465 [Cooperia oncophora]